jgi:TatD DNase family protein
MIDSHCHIISEEYAHDRKEVLDATFSAGIKYIVVPSTKPSDIKDAISVAEEYERIYCGIGVHPHDAKDWTADVLEYMRKRTSHDKVVAIGEIGLDYHYNFSTPAEQRTAFAEQIELAKSVHLPIIVHNRESDKDMLSMLSEHYSDVDSDRKGVIHCYSSDVAMLGRLLELGFYISYTANITFKNTDLDAQVDSTPLDRLLLETDSPYMTPPPNRGKRNTPQSVQIVAEKISQIKNIPISEVINMTTKNAKHLFNLPLLIIALFFGTLFLDSADLYSQNRKTADIEEYDDEYLDEDDEPDPYVRRVGFGPVFGSNTFVDRYTTKSKSFSYEGLLNYGGIVNVRVLEALIIQGVYTYSKNNYFVNALPDTIKNSADRWLDPNYHRAVELNVIGMLRPKKMVNFYGSVGATYFMNKLSRFYQDKEAGELRPSKKYVDDDQLGINAGVGAFINISIGSGGTISIFAEWKLGFRVDKSKLPYDPRYSPEQDGYQNPVEYTSMSSVPRGGVIWYIPWVK